LIDGVREKDAHFKLGMLKAGAMARLTRRHWALLGLDTKFCKPLSLQTWTPIILLAYISNKCLAMQRKPQKE
jgi:hypothetical protein